MMQRIINEIWTDCSEADLAAGEQYRVSVGQGGWQQQCYILPVEKIKTNKITTRAFMQRFTQPERTAIRKSTNDIVIDIHEDLKALRGRHVVMDDPDTLTALVYLTGVGILVAGRSDTILNAPIAEDEV